MENIQTSISEPISARTLTPSHFDHLIAQGFTPEHIDIFFNDGIIESLNPEQAYKAGFGVAIDGKPVTGGLKLNFSPTYAQLMLDDREIIFDAKKQRSVKYLSLPGAIESDCAYIPDGCKAVTEGMKDALAFSHIGGIPTGALAGLSHATKALPRNCGYTIIADYDAWVNFSVFQALIKAGVHCGGKVAIVPAIEDEPKAGGVEYFKAGNTAANYQQFLEGARSPIVLYEQWLTSLPTISSPSMAGTQAVNTAKLLGEIYGYAESGTVGEIKLLLKSDRFTEWDLRLADVLRDSSNTQSALKAKEKSEDEADDRRAVEIAIELIKERAKLFHSPSPDSNEYADIPSKTGVMTTHAISSREFKSWVVGEYYRKSGKGLTGESMNTILATIHAIAAHDSPELPLSEQRIAAYQERYYLHLADDAQTVIEYSSTGWHVCENPPVKFVFDRYKSPLPIPQRQGAIDKLWDLVRIKNDDDRLMVTAVLVKGLVPLGDDPILAISGYAGSGKTTTAKYLRSLIDPFTKGKVLAKIPDTDHLAIHAKKRRILAIDNISHITADQSDTLCNVSTKAGISKRTLFTDDGETILDIGNLLILTSIGNVVTKPDLLDRSINIDMPRLTSDDRASTADLAAEFDRCHGEILGGLLNITVAALHHRDTTPCPTFSRLTEFAHLGEGIEKNTINAIGSFSRRMAAGVEIANEIAIDSSPVASIIREWMGIEREWSGTTAELLNILKTHAKKSELAGTLPKTANSLGSELKKCESALAQCGIIIEDFRESKVIDPNQTKKKRIYISEKVVSPFSTSTQWGGESSPPSPPIKMTHLEPNPINGYSGGELGGEQPKCVNLHTNSSISINRLEDSSSNGSSGGERGGEQIPEQTGDDEYPNQDDV